MTGFLIDAGILIRELRSDQRAGLLLTHLGGRSSIATSAIVVFEVFRGCRDDIERLAADRLLEDLDVIDITYSIAAGAGRLVREWPGIFSSEKAVPDAIIAASAIAAEATLVTLNARQFSRLRIPGLDLLLVDQQAADWIPTAP